ncbi:two-component sensor histidine kinase [Brachybacterium vulturis]|uniref:Signal transduction histidine-protein kinase/phosphatase MprB n=1 Tax=Brachybacterium vulturis TaxID=2017484 RepID=A0A291GN86_9MICO|nr:HAMP domain-containing sensor histidine kinase [Brachybacterium vulturis]ATG51681.1 two-component sensor histidine kinase [Brachybacterium vulturis]
MTPAADGAGDAQRRVPDRLDVRPLDRFHSFKVKLGILVGASVSVAALLTQVSIRAGIQPLLALPLVVIAALVFTQLLARGMTSPLREMTGAARAMARGDYSRAVSTTSRDEVGQLASAFSTMASELEQTDRMRRDLVANVSHELRTPVTGLRAQLENLVDGVTEPDPAALEVALTETERLSQLVDHLLDLSRLDAGVVELDVEEVELTPFLHEVVDAASLASGGRDVRWIIDVEPADLAVPADAARLHQVIHNLLENAARHSPAGGRIHVSAARTEQDDGVRIDVHDEGPGIAREDRSRVFERFQRGGYADTSGGTGLGLAIARWAVGLHGGSIEVLDDPRSEHAQEGRSSLIRVMLPDTAATP